MHTNTMLSRLGYEYMYRTIYLSDRRQLQKLCHILDANSSLGHYVRAIYIYDDDRLGSTKLNALGMDDCLVSLVRHCPNLQHFIVVPELDPASFLSVADALRTYCTSSLKLLQWRLFFSVQGKVPQVLRTMRHLVALQIELSYPPSETTGSFAGIRQLVDVCFPHLRQICLRGAIQDFVEQIATWEMPVLAHLTLDFKLCQNDFPDLNEILATHGPQLDLLDINALPTLDVPTILNICSKLTTFCFNLDWQLEGMMVARPHATLQTIGLYGLRHAFGVGFPSEVAQVNPFEAAVLRRRNDMNFHALNKTSFPALQRIRILETTLLQDLNRSNGPDQGISGGYNRWERWWDQCANHGIRLEDCTGDFLGTLPQHDEDGLDSESQFSEGLEEVSEGAGKSA